MGSDQGIVQLPELVCHARSRGFVNGRSLLAGAPLLRGVNWSSEARYRRWSIWISARMRQFLNLRIVAHQYPFTSGWRAV